MEFVSSVNLDKDWKLYQRLLGCTADERFLLEKESGDALSCNLPCDIHMPLIEAGIIRDPVLADYSFDCEWTAERSWWFVKKFTADESMQNSSLCELVIESIDTFGEVFLNGQKLGVSESVHVPFVREVGHLLRKGENCLVVRVTTGLEKVTEEDLAEINFAVCHEKSNGCPERGDLRRAFVRRPQYSTGWDWGPKVPTCGITGHAFLRVAEEAVIRGVNLKTESIGDPAILCAEIETELLNPFGTADASITIELCREGAVCARSVLEDVLLCSGTNFSTLRFPLPHPQLWWPNGMGEQPLYTVSVSVQIGENICRYPAFQFGVRTIKLLTHRQSETHRAFELAVNDVPVFCKGGNWIPADSIYARISDETYRTAVQEAAAANFNMLRVWGGGIYEPDVFYTACDEAGILVWHDFMFGCSAYPDHLEHFQELCRQELDYQTKRLRCHACMALWCGNNEDHSIFNSVENPGWGLVFRHERQYGLQISNEMAVKIVRMNCPQIPYWRSSPYGGALPNDDTVGDVHHWHRCMMNPDMALRIDPEEYDKADGRFISEYGYPGPPCRKTMEEYFAGQPVERGSRVWQLHTNTFEKDTVAAGICKHYGSANDLSLDQYILYAGMVQMLMYQYSLESFRFRTSCGGGLFWMYHDTWGEVGWTIIDYALRRKIAYYGVKRAFEPVRAILRRKEGRYAVLLANDTPHALQFSAQVGYLSFDGKESRLEECSISVPAYSRTQVFEGEIGVEDLKRGTFVFLPDSSCSPAALRCADWPLLELPAAAFEVSQQDDGDDRVVTVSSDRFVHGVYFDGDFRAEDNYFDLLPGQKKVFRVFGAAGKELVFSSVAVRK